MTENVPDCLKQTAAHEPGIGQTKRIQSTENRPIRRIALNQRSEIVFVVDCGPPLTYCCFRPEPDCLGQALRTSFVVINSFLPAIERAAQTPPSSVLIGLLRIGILVAVQPEIEPIYHHLLMLS